MARGSFTSREVFGSDGNQVEVKTEGGKFKVTRLWTKTKLHNFSVPKEVYDACMAIGHSVGWEVSRMKPYVLTQDCIQPRVEGKEQITLKAGTNLMATRDMKLRIVPSAEQRRRYGTAIEAAKAARKKGLLKTGELDIDMMEKLRIMNPQDRCQHISTGSADKCLYELAEAKWLTEDQLKVVRARIFKYEEEQGELAGRAVKHRKYIPGPGGYGEILAPEEADEAVIGEEAGTDEDDPRAADEEAEAEVPSSPEPTQEPLEKSAVKPGKKPGKKVK